MCENFLRRTFDQYFEAYSAQQQTEEKEPDLINVGIEQSLVQGNSDSNSVNAEKNLQL